MESGNHSTLYLAGYFLNRLRPNPLNYYPALSGFNPKEATRRIRCYEAIEWRASPRWCRTVRLLMIPASVVFMLEIVGILVTMLMLALPFFRLILTTNSPHLATAWLRALVLDPVFSPLFLAPVAVLALHSYAYRAVCRRVEPKVLAELRQGRMMVCQACGYDLRGSPQPTCPECGQTSRLSITRDTPVPPPPPTPG